MLKCSVALPMTSSLYMQRKIMFQISLDIAASRFSWSEAMLKYEALSAPTFINL